VRGTRKNPFIAWRQKSLSEMRTQGRAKKRAANRNRACPISASLMPISATAEIGAVEDP
jgi:hypothetical protein